MWHQLERWDKAFYIKINSEWTNSLFDAIMPFIRNEYFWPPVYIFLLLFATLNFKVRGWWWAMFFLCTFALTDMISSRLIKETVERLRPCNDPTMSEYVRVLIDCGSGYSFTSSHAANHFGIATFFFITMRNIIPKWAWVGFAWAFSVIYAQVYVGIHYPLDVLGGAVIGMIIGTITGNFFTRRFGFHAIPLSR
jgi:membrane-associated phospholipid phosphatase